MAELFTRGLYSVANDGVIKGIESKGVSTVRYQTVGSPGSDVVRVYGSVDDINFELVEDSELTGDGQLLVAVLAYSSIEIRCDVFGGTPFKLHALYGNLSSSTKLSEPISVSIDPSSPVPVVEDTILTERYEWDGDDDVLYAGFALPGTLESDSTWRIRKFLYDGSKNVTTIIFADGDDDFDNQWSNRASLSYS